MNENREPAFWPWFVSLGACSVLTGYFLAQADHVTAISVIVVALSALTGHCLMASRLLCLHCGFVVAALLTTILCVFCRPTLAAWFGTSGMVLSIIVTGIAVALIISAALRRLVVKLCSERPTLDACNRWAGFGIGAVQGAALCVLVIGGLLVLEPIAKNRLVSDVQLLDHKIARVLAAKTIRYTGQIRDSAIGPGVARYNPFEHLPPLKRLRSNLRDLGHPLTGTLSASERTINEHLSARSFADEQ